MRQLFAGTRVRFVPMDAFPDIRPAREDGATFRANAVKKAVHASRRTILPVVAEDSGLEVEALGGRPGVRSARFARHKAGGQAGAAQDDRANVRKLLRLLAGVPARRRKARYVCCIALAAGGRVIRTFEGTCGGSIAESPKGNTGFGYDPVFVPARSGRTMAQLGPGIKHTLSHRSKAARRFRDWLAKKCR